MSVRRFSGFQVFTPIVTHQPTQPVALGWSILSGEGRETENLEPISSASSHSHHLPLKFWGMSDFLRLHSKKKRTVDTSEPTGTIGYIADAEGRIEHY